MMKYLVLTDSNDADLGSFFEASASDLIENWNFPSTAFLHLNGTKLNNVHLDLVLADENNSFVLFVAYCHGYFEGFSFNNGLKLIDYQSNFIHKFNGAIVYSIACSSGKIFGQKAIDAGAECFIGYKEKVIVIVDYLIEYVKCSNAGLHQLIAGCSSDIAYKAIKHQFKNFMKQLNYLDQAVINDNLDQLVILGKKDSYLK